jgi:maltose O-acetyltransferase
MTQKERMLKGLIYDPSDEELLALRKKSHKLCLEYNNTTEDDFEKRDAILKELGIKLGKNVYLQGPIYLDYGCFISIGDNSYANFNLTVLDTCPVTIGKNVFMGTGVSIVTPLHPFRYQERNLYQKQNGQMTDDEYGKPIVIEDNCWIASNVIIVGGVTIGEGSVIGAGSVVTRSIPKNSLAVGNPCKVIREITEQDKVSDLLK